MSALPDISVIIPCYNGERFIGDAIASVLAQDGGEPEIVVVDDGSSDGSAGIVRSLADPRVRLVPHEKNRGISAARNTGVAATGAPLLAFLDQDDIWLPGRLSAHLAILAQHPRVGLVFSDVIRHEADGRRWRQRPSVPRHVQTLNSVALVEVLVRDNFVALGSASLRRECIEAAGSFDESIRGGSDDFDMLIRLAEHTRFAHVPQVLFERRIHGENYTRADRMLGEAIAVIDRAERRYPAIRRGARIGRGRILYRLAREQHGRASRELVAQTYDRALREWPWQPRAVVGRLLCTLGKVGDGIVRWMGRGQGG